MNTFKQLLHTAGDAPPIGSWIMSASPIVAEAMGHAGFDWAVLDMEHTPIDLMGLVNLLQAVSGTPLEPVVRVPWNDSVTIKRVLDAGAKTLLVPFVQNAAEARAAVDAVRYPPQGRRGLAAMGRASKFGTVPDFASTENQRVALIVQLETVEAIANLEAIAAIDGIDALFIGPGDLSATMGHVGQLTHPEVLDVTSGAVRRARALGVPIGTVGGTPAVVQQYLEMGFDFVAIASDLGLLMRSAQAAIAAVRPKTAAAAASTTQQGAY